MKVTFTLQDLNATVKRLATEDMPAPDAPLNEWKAWRTRWQEGIVEVMRAMVSSR